MQNSVSTIFQVDAHETAKCKSQISENHEQGNLGKRKPSISHKAEPPTKLLFLSQSGIFDYHPGIEASFVDPAIPAVSAVHISKKSTPIMEATFAKTARRNSVRKQLLGARPQQNLRKRGRPPKAEKLQGVSKRTRKCAVPDRTCKSSEKKGKDQSIANSGRLSYAGISTNLSTRMILRSKKAFPTELIQ